MRRFRVVCAISALIAAFVMHYVARAGYACEPPVDTTNCPWIKTANDNIVYYWPVPNVCSDWSVGVNVGWEVSDDIDVTDIPLPCGDLSAIVTDFNNADSELTLDAINEGACGNIHIGIYLEDTELIADFGSVNILAHGVCTPPVFTQDGKIIQPNPIIGVNNYQYANDNYTKVIRHELGHALALEHTATPSRLMTQDYGMAAEAMAAEEKATYEAVYSSAHRACCEDAGGEYGPLYIAALRTIVCAGGDSVSVAIEYPTAVATLEFASSLNGTVWAPYDTVSVNGEAVVWSYCAGDGEAKRFRTRAYDGEWRQLDEVQWGETPSIEEIMSTTEDEWTWLRQHMTSPYWCAIADKVQSVPDVGSWSGQPCNYLMIASSDLVASVAPLAEHYSSSGITTVLLRYDAGPCRRDEIRRAVGACAQYGALRGVLLIGDADRNSSCDDWKLNGGSGSNDRIPTYFEQAMCAPDAQDLYATDTPYADYDSDGIMNAAVGRIPADCEEDCIHYVYNRLYFAREIVGGGNALYDSRYAYSEVHVVPTNMARADLPGGVLDDSAVDIQEAGAAVAGIVEESGGSVMVRDTTELQCWLSGSSEEYWAGSASVLENDLLQGGYIVYGLPRHASSLGFGNVYYEPPLFARERAIYGHHFVFQCSAGKTWEHLADSWYETGGHWKAADVELFEGKWLTFVGPSGPTFLSDNALIATECAKRLSAEIGSGRGVGEAWMQAMNAVSRLGYEEGAHARSYMFLGDPLTPLYRVGVATGMSGEQNGVTSGVRPNPFNTRTTFVLPENAGDAIAAKLYDVRGRVVRHVSAVDVSRETNAFCWDGKDDNGEVMPSGVYALKWKSREAEGVIRCMLIK